MEQITIEPIEGSRRDILRQRMQITLIKETERAFHTEQAEFPKFAWKRANLEPEFFAYVKHANRTGFLLGPYATKEQADQNVTRARELAEARDKFAAFYEFGSCKVPNGEVLSSVFGA